MAAGAVLAGARGVAYGRYGFGRPIDEVEAFVSSIIAAMNSAWQSESRCKVIDLGIEQQVVQAVHSIMQEEHRPSGGTVGL